MLKFFKVNEMEKVKKIKRGLNNKGLSVVELIIALAISVIVVAAAGFILLTQSGVIRLNRSVSTEQQRLNTAFNTVRYAIRMAGFDYGQRYYVQTGFPAVQIVNASPYEVLVSYSTVVNGSSPCTLASVGAVPGEFSYSGSCPNFYVGQSLNIINAVPPSGKSLPQPPFVLCVTGTPAGKFIQTNPGADAACPGDGNLVPPKNFDGGNVSSINQVLFYWGAVPYTAPDNGPGITSPFNIPGNLYECQVAPVVISPTVPTCMPNTTITLSDYINSFAVNPVIPPPLPPPDSPPYYLYTVSITGESNVALSDSPAYSVHVPETYDGNLNGPNNAKGNAGQIVGNNVLKTLNSNVFLRNVYYGS
ncbi:MAG: hypothetical protein M0Z72_04905 [Deltaproteobacteria bacterium]|nr:hypothetical protein [Deltaproteobacteria bacterium]